MADGIEVRFNIPDFRRQLQALRGDIERRVVRAATNAAAQVFKKAAIQRAPILRGFGKRRVPGLLRRAMYVVRSRSNSGPGKEVYSVSFRKGKRGRNNGTGIDAFYGAFLESGWVPVGRGRRVHGGKNVRALARSRRSHQKITKYRFLAPAFNQVGAEALKAFNARIEKRITAENAKRK